jgi:hypothetical protein
VGILINNKNGEKIMANLKPKIEKVLVKTINEHFKDFYKAYVENDKIMVKMIDPDFVKEKADEWFHVPKWEHQDDWCFMCDGGMGWELVNPCDAEYPDYEFEEKLDKNFQDAGLFCEPYASWKHIVYKEVA